MEALSTRFVHESAPLLLDRFPSIYIELALERADEPRKDKFRKAKGPEKALDIIKNTPGYHLFNVSFVVSDGSPESPVCVTLDSSPANLTKFGFSARFRMHLDRPTRVELFDLYQRLFVMFVEAGGARTGAVWFGGAGFEYDPYSGLRTNRAVPKPDEVMGYSSIVVLTPEVIARLGGLEHVHHSPCEAITEVTDPAATCTSSRCCAEFPTKPPKPTFGLGRRSSLLSYGRPHRSSSEESSSSTPTTKRSCSTRTSPTHGAARDTHRHPVRSRRRTGLACCGRDGGFDLACAHECPTW